MSTKYSQLKNFTSLDSSAFGALLRRLGYQSAAAYLVRDGKLQLLLAGNDSETSPWPVTAEYISNYTSFDANDLFGWTKAGTGFTARKDWPKAINFYFPEQDCDEEKLVFAVQNATGKRCRFGELDGYMEAIANRMRNWVSDSVNRANLSDTGFRETVKALGSDLQMLIDHELRTPLTSVSGYLSLARELDPNNDRKQWDEYCQIIESQTSYALEALDKLTFSMSAKVKNLDPESETTEFDASMAVNEVCDRIIADVREIVSPDAAFRTTIKFSKDTDRSCNIIANKKLFHWSLWEVIKNAVIHSKSGEVEVNVYHSDSMMVIDVVDDGGGIAEGSEELIFLRFYQDPKSHTSRKGKRGLGLGLFLARHIVERHLGRLNFVRRPNKSSVFRFMWPVVEVKEKKLPKGA
jgi:signal transduction histidine kinase